LAAGIVITAGANNNIIGSIDKPNIIAYNDSTGIVIADNTTLNNRISGNSIYNNGYLGIDIIPGGVNENDPGDLDMGPNMQMNFPVITDNYYDGESPIAVIKGSLDTQNPENCIVEIYTAIQDDEFTNGEGFRYVASAVPDASGNWQVYCEDGQGGDYLTALAIDENGNTSEFAANIDHVTKLDDLLGSTNEFAVFPNPVKEIFFVKIPETSEYVDITIIDCRGRVVKTLFSGKTDESVLKFNAVELGLVSGVYMISLLENEKIVVVVEMSVVR